MSDDVLGLNETLLDESQQRKLAATYTGVTLADCYPYHWYDMPNGETVIGSWDLRKNWRKYLGDVDFRGARVFEPGPASAYLTMQMERLGADVVSFDLPPGTPPDLLPHPGRDMAATAISQAAGIDRVRNSWWYFHRAFGLRAKAAYGDIYSLPNSLGRFDTTVMAAILLHLKNPIAAVQQVAAITDNTIIVTDLLHRPFGENAYMEFSPHADNGDPMTWWYISPAAIGRMLKAVGFGRLRISEHSHRHYPTLKPDKSFELEFFTVVGERT